MRCGLEGWHIAIALGSWGQQQQNRNESTWTHGGGDPGGFIPKRGRAAHRAALPTHPTYAVVLGNSPHLHQWWRQEKRWGWGRPGEFTWE